MDFSKVCQIIISICLFLLLIYLITSTYICLSVTGCLPLSVCLRLSVYTFLYLTTYLSLSVKLPQFVFIFIHLCSVFLPITLYLS